MATRLRLPSAGTPAVSPAFQTYTHTGTTRRPLPLTDSSALATTAVTPDAADHIAAGDTFHAQFISTTLAPQVIASSLTVKLALQCLEADAGNNLFLQLWLGIYNASGSTLLATLRAKTLDGTELNTTIQNRILNTTTTAGYTCTGGERLVAEISVSGTPVATGGVQGHNASLRFGANGVGGDGGENDTDTGATLNPWLELSQDLVFAPLMESLVSYWKLDEASGNRADSYAANPLPPVNAPGNVSGLISTALNVDRPGFKFLSYAGSGLNIGSTDSWSWSCWVNPTDRSGYFTVVNDQGESPRKIYFFLEQSSGQLARWDAFFTGLIVPMGAWSHLVYTFASGGTDTGTETAYLNAGTPATRTGAVPAPGTGFFNVGSALSTGSQIFLGGIDELGLWRRALSAAEVAQLYNGGAGLPYPLVVTTQTQAPRSMHQFRMRRAA